MGLAAIDLTMSWVIAPLTERPKNTSAPTKASASVRALVVDGVGRLPLVHAFGAAFVDHAFGVAEDGVFVRHAHRLDEFEAGDAGGARAVDDHLRGLDVAAGQVERVDEGGRGDDCGAVLVVVEDGDVINSRKRCSMMKQSGALMSSRLMPPKVGPR